MFVVFSYVCFVVNVALKGGSQEVVHTAGSGPFPIPFQRPEFSVQKFFFATQ